MKLEIFVVRLEPDVIEWLKKKAKEEGVAVSKVARRTMKIGMHGTAWALKKTQGEGDA